MKEPLKGKNIVLGVTGSIAAFKAAELAGRLVALGADVRVVMTREAAEFITPLTMQTLSRHPVAVDLWDKSFQWEPEHIALADRADLLLVAPATAHIMACFAQGLAPDLLTCIYLAAKAPVLLAPAMNGKMWAHPATKENAAKLAARGVHIIGPEKGMLACGYEGEGRMSSVESIIAAAAKILRRNA